MTGTNAVATLRAEDTNASRTELTGVSSQEDAFRLDKVWHYGCIVTQNTHRLENTFRGIPATVPMKNESPQELIWQRSRTALN